MSQYTATGNSSPIVISLPAGTWTINVAGVNAAGTGYTSASITATVAAPPPYNTPGPTFPATYPLTF